jgi:photosystem II stability/assembly factor-like uncharacterized protein
MTDSLERFLQDLHFDVPAGLVERAKAAAAADVAGAPHAAHGTVRYRGDFDTQRPPWALALVATLLVVAIVATLLFTARALRSHTAPARTPPPSSSGSCSPGSLHMMTATVGWQDGPARTTDGGITWQSIPLPALPDGAKGGSASCFLDADHAWVTQAAGPSQIQPDHLVIFRTADGGQTWQRGLPVPISGVLSSARLGFIDSQHGWLLTDSGRSALDKTHTSVVSQPLVRAIYATTDGGATWSPLVSAREADKSTLGTLALGCSITGLTFASLDRGWVTWDCNTTYGSFPTQQQATHEVAGTQDGGRSWQPVELPSFPSSIDWTCGAFPPVFTQSQGVLPVECSGTGLSAVYATDDAGRSWSYLKSPFFGTPDFVDANTGWAFSRIGAGNDLYKTTNGGRDWTLVKPGLFSGQNVDVFQFLGGGIGFLYTVIMGRQGAPWKSTDGGQTWSVSAPYRTIAPNMRCDLPANPGAGPTPVPVTMQSPTTGWARGALRTTDGGTRWLNVAPPSVPDRSSGNAEFFLDATHAWIAQTAGSSNACADHIVTFGTADGGLTWQQAAPIPVQVSAATTDVIWKGHSTSFSPTTSRPEGEGPWLYFTDPRNGWLLVESGGDMFYAYGPLYRTTDGGLHWNQVSVDPFSALKAFEHGCEGGGTQTGMSFASATTGWIVRVNCTGVLALSVTHDGGFTWKVQVLPAICCVVNPPTFFDASHGMLFGDGDGVILVTSDGGSTWSTRTLPLWTSQWSIDAVDFINPNEGWALVSARLYRTGNGGRTWTLVNANLPPPPQNVQLSSLDFVDASNGFWATGSQLLKTTDGGHSWTVIQTTAQ